MRDLILNNESYTDEQWREIADYNRDDVLDAIPLLEAIAPYHRRSSGAVPWPLRHRGR